MKRLRSSGFWVATPTGLSLIHICLKGVLSGVMCTDIAVVVYLTVDGKDLLAVGRVQRLPTRLRDVYKRQVRYHAAWPLPGPEISF